MREDQPSAPIDLGHVAAGLSAPTHHPRLTELLDPHQFAEYAAETLPGCHERGYAVRTVIAASDVHLLTDDSARCETLLHFLMRRKHRTSSRDEFVESRTDRHKQAGVFYGQW